MDRIQGQCEKRSPILASIVSQHVEDVTMQWVLRSGAIAEPHYRLADLAKLDGRVEAHLDGLRIAGDEGWELCLSELKWQEPGEVFSAAVLAFDNGSRDRIDHVVEVGSSAPELERGLISAMGWTPAACVSELIVDLSQSAAPARRRVAMGALAIRREDPGRWLIDAFRDADPGVRARAQRAAGELGKADFIHEVRQGLANEDSACRYCAAWAAARLGDRSSAVAQALRDLAAQPGPFQGRAVATAVRIMPPSEVGDWLRPFWKDVKTLRLASAGIAASGNPEFFPVLLQIMQVNEAARAAGEAFSMITGADLAYLDLERDQPEDFQAGPTEDPADENIAMDPDENLPWPDPVLVEKWWQSNSAQFAAGRRYLCGRPIEAESCREVLRTGYQRQRAAAAMELAMLQPHQPLFEVRARGSWQQQWLKS
jgi:uncharacterized protein (TIGR02270 family)